jgi:hypothetical protein
MATDNRVFLRMKRRGMDPLFQNKILEPLAVHGGILFPYTPTIMHSQKVNWQTMNLTHTNYQPQVFVNSANPAINISSAKFTATTQKDAEYLLAVLFFFKMVTKMNFGKNDPMRGAPPPVLELSGYGESQYRNVPVVITNVNYSYPDDIDYISITPAFYQKGMSGVEMVPTVMSVSIDLMVQYNAKTTKDMFTLADLASGQISKKGYI